MEETTIEVETEFVNVEEFPDYEINRVGVVKRKRDGFICKISPQGASKSLKVNIRFKKEKYKARNISSLLAVAFIDNPNNYKFVSFRNEDLEDIVIDNLYWSKTKFRIYKDLSRDENGRICTKCKIYKTWDNFTTQKDGYNDKCSYCKSCYKQYNSGRLKEKSEYDSEYRVINSVKIEKHRKEYYIDHRSEFLERSKISKNSPVKYDVYKNQLTIDDKPERDSEGYLIVACKYCKKMFKPTRSQARCRINALNNFNLGESNFYCSQECKTDCPVYARTLYRKGEFSERLPSGSAFFKESVLKRDNFECQICGNIDDLQVHHIVPVAKSPLESDDIDNGITLCKECHIKAHNNIPGCSYHALSTCNVLDRRLKKRNPKFLTDEQIIFICESLEKGLKGFYIADKVNKNQSVISKIKKRRIHTDISKDFKW